MTDEQLSALLDSAGWRLFYTYENGEEEYTGPGESDTPNTKAIRALVDAAIAAERERWLSACRGVRVIHAETGRENLRAAHFSEAISLVQMKALTPNV